jgi:hypothetical protein
MTVQTEPGTITLGDRDVLHIDIESEHYQISREDVRNLLFYGRVVPVIQIHRQKSGSDPKAMTVSIEGHAAMNVTGKAVKIFTRAGHCIIPLVSFQRVAKGEAISAPLFPLIPEYPGGPA